MSLTNVYKDFESHITATLSWLRDEIVSLRTGRVVPAMIEDIMIEQYGTKMPLKGVASITNADARTLMVSAWDAAIVPEIEKAITDANLGVAPIVDGSNVRLSFPALTEEGREDTVKVLHRQAEEARIRLRKGRDEGIKTMKSKKEDGEISEDDMRRGKQKLDEMIQTANKEIEGIVQQKEIEIRAI